MAKRILSWLIASWIVLCATPPGHAQSLPAVRVVDFYSGNPIRRALVTFNDEVSLTDGGGGCFVKATGIRFAVRAPGYRGTNGIIPTSANHEPHTVRLIPITPKALYLSFYGIGDRALRESALKLIEETELNALVIDVKGDRGMIPYRSPLPLASEVGAQRVTTVRDIDDLIKTLKERGIYTIARIVVFKDNPLALARPEWAVKAQNGDLWRDREQLAWVDPFRKEVWDYNIAIAVDAARRGFDEIQFDYVRFPDEPANGLKFSQPNTEENRVRAISGFLREAQNRLIPYNVFLASDIFGYVCWNLNDTHIGQKLEEMMAYVDYLAPMLYPSGFQFGIPRYRIPVANAYEIVYLSLKRAQERTRLPSVRFRPWLQSFRDYAFDKRYFKDKEIRDQINAAEAFGSNGWMLWNPCNNYSSAGLKKERPWAKSSPVWQAS